MLNTNSYEKVQVELLSSVFNQLFGLSSTVYFKVLGCHIGGKIVFLRHRGPISKTLWRA
jgi:hypothetical protein